LDLEVTEEAKDALAAAGFDPEFGARPLKRCLQQAVIEPLSRGILEGRFPPKTRVRVDCAAPPPGGAPGAETVAEIPRITVSAA
jgi:ATP-dependent Clp protease ATP-binding subunit ClpB